MRIVCTVARTVHARLNMVLCK